MRASLERTDSAGSGSEAPDVLGLRTELRALRAERDAATQRVNEVYQQLQASCTQRVRGGWGKQAAGQSWVLPLQRDGGGACGRVICCCAPLF